MPKAAAFTIAIDGPAASGKSTTAWQVARALGFLYIDSGAMYRAVTLAAIRRGIAVDDARSIAALARKLDITLSPGDSGNSVFLDGEDVTEAIRRPEVTRQISPVAANPLVRKNMVARQRRMGRAGGVVMDGRDIGTVVFPRASLKIYLFASVKERARRRLKELQARGVTARLEDIEVEIQRRDDADTGREHGPLRQAPDAIRLDTTCLSIPEQVEKIVTLAQEKIRS
jgi:cytidylate kinase